MSGMSTFEEKATAELIRAAREVGVRINKEYAKRYIAARLKLHEDPTDAAAKEVVNHFQTLMSPLGRFTLPYADWLRHCDKIQDPNDPDRIALGVPVEDDQ